MERKWKLKCGVLLALCINTAYADDNTNDRVAQLQKMLEEQQKAMQEQQWQMKAMADELTALQKGRSNDKGKSTGSPVYASFKDGITFGDGSGNWQLAINGRVQADYRNFSPDVDAADTFSLRRARLGGTLTFYKDYVARVEGEYAGGSTTLTYGYIDVNKFAAAKVRVGQFKPFYGLERAMSTNFTDFQERSLADAQLGSTFDRGVMVFGTPTAGVSYSLAYLNGTGTVDENNAKDDGKDLAVRLTANLAEIQHWQNAVVHFGGFYADGNEGSRRQANFIPAGQTEARGLQFFSTTCSAAACGGTTATANAFKDNVSRTRAGYETALAYGPVKFQGEYINTSLDGPGYSRDINAWYASTLWNVTGESFAGMYKDGVFGRLKPKNNYKGGGAGWGALQIGVRYSKLDASDFKSSNSAGTGVLLKTSPLPAPGGTTADGLLVAASEADAWTVGANWILNPNFRIVTNWVRTNYDTPVVVRVNGINKSLDKEDALTMRAQFDF